MMSAAKAARVKATKLKLCDSLAAYLEELTPKVCHAQDRRHPLVAEKLLWLVWESLPAAGHFGMGDAAVVCMPAPQLVCVRVAEDQLLPCACMRAASHVHATAHPSVLGGRRKQTAQSRPPRLSTTKGCR